MSRRRRFFAQKSRVPVNHFMAFEGAVLNVPIKDHQGRVRVWTSRVQAERDLVRELGKDSVFSIAGMGDEKWALFQKEVPHVLVPCTEDRIDFSEGEYEN